jgi:hypothetical protein
MEEVVVAYLKASPTDICAIKYSGTIAGTLEIFQNARQTLQVFQPGSLHNQRA